MIPRPFARIFLPAACLLFGACTHYYYAPNTVQTPFLQQRHDAQADLGLVNGDQFSGWEAHVVYSPLKYTAVMANYFRVGSEDVGDPDKDWGKGHLAEFGLGAYLPAGSYTSFSLFGGWGYGRVLHSYSGAGKADLNFRRWFVQPGIAIQRGWVRFGAAMRLVRLEYAHGDINYAIGEPHLSDLKRVQEASPIFIPETGLMVGFGVRPIWAHIHLNLNSLSERERLNFASYSMGVSLNLQLDYFWRQNRN